MGKAKGTWVPAKRSGWDIAWLITTFSARWGFRFGRWGGRHLWRASKVGGRYTWRASKWTGRHSAALSTRAARAAQAQLAHASYELSKYSTERGNTKAASGLTWLGDLITRQARVTCAACGASMPESQSFAHLQTHERDAVADLQAARKRRAARTPARQTVAPARPTSVTAAGPTPTRPGSPVSQPSPIRFPAKGSATSAAPKTVPLFTPQPTIRGGHVSEIRKFTVAAAALGDMQPENAWDLDAQLGEMAVMWFPLGEAISAYTENLDRHLKVDPRVLAPLYAAAGDLADLVKTIQNSRMVFRSLYAAQFEAAEANVRTIADPKFFDGTAA